MGTVRVNTTLDDALNAYRQGRITLREFADVLHLGTWAAHDLLLAEGVAVAQGSRADTSAALEALLGQARPDRRRPSQKRR